MTSRAHIVQSNGMSRGPLIDSIRPYPDAIRYSLNRMNGTSFWAYSLWRAPDDADLLADIPLSDEYVQCAGTAAAMTVEVRTVDPDGTAHQFAVGKPGADHAAGRTEMIRWDDDRSSTTVHPHEVFTADEAADVFYSYFLTNEVSAPYVLRELDLTVPSPGAEATADRVRELIFSDDDENEQTWRPSSQDGQQSAADAFWEFVSEHGRDDNASFCIEDDQNSEALLVMLGAQTICRARSEPSTRTEYRIVTNDGTYGTLVQNFVRGGFAALDRHGPWWPDVPSLLRARLRLELDESPLRRTHPRELCRRLEILTFVDGREPTTIEGVTHYGFADGEGGSVNAWMAADGRGLLVTFDPASALRSTDAGQHADLYAGVPTDLLAMVRDVAQADPTLNVASPDGRSGLAATGVFHFSGPCAMADGLVSSLQESQLGIDDTGVNRLLEAFLELDDFTPQAVAHAADWWSIGDVERGFAAAAASGEADQTSAAPLDREAVRRFCQIWDDSGYNDRWDVHYVFFDSWSVDQAGAVRDELLGLVRDLGLQRVDAPRGSATGEVWVRTDPRIDFELG